MQRWEYCFQSIIVGEPESEVRLINQLGAEGWEAYAVITGVGGGMNIINYYFKRPSQTVGNNDPKPSPPSREKAY